ncbi:MAG: carbamoyl phosphate synthase small subunit [Tissierellia bacterium]|nr:carbamoyl phosphate synthase small subunit [Tissierellia bacterium]
MTKRFLVLEDGTYYEGKAIGGDDFRVGELVFNTSMAGYQEVLSDPSYYGQIITMTYPMIGNYGINRDGFESITQSIFGFVISEHCDNPSNWKSQMSVDEFLKLRNIPGIEDIDTRKLAKHIRDSEPLKATFSDSIENLDAIIREIKETNLDIDLVEMVSISKPFHIPNDNEKIVLIDFGSINDILKELNSRDLDITVVPYDSRVDDILSLHPDGIVLSNGPGNPKALPFIIENIKELIGKAPMLGIGIGHQLIALACGADTKRLRVGNMGSNYPIKRLDNGKVEIQCKNNAFVVDKDSLENTGLSMTHLGINEETCEGLEDVAKQIYSVQFHPKYSLDTRKENPVYKKFIEMIRVNKEREDA